MLLLLLLRNVMHVDARPSVPGPHHDRRRLGGRDGHRLRDRNGYCCCSCWRRRMMCRGGNRRRRYHLWNRRSEGGGPGGVEPPPTPATPGLTSPAPAPSGPGQSTPMLMLLTVVLLAVLVKGGGPHRRRWANHCGGDGDWGNGWGRHVQQDMRGGK